MYSNDDLIKIIQSLQVYYLKLQVMNDDFQVRHYNIGNTIYIVYIYIYYIYYI